MTTVADVLGIPDDEVPAALEAVGGPATGVTVERVPYASGSPATGGLWRLRGAGWSLFVKHLRHLRHWPALAQMPPAVAEQFAAEFPWRSEIELWDPRVQQSLPDGLRSPVLHRLVERPDDRIALWQEDVVHDEGQWDDDRFARAAALLGEWNGRSTAPEVLAVSAYPPGFGLRMYAERSVPFRGLAPLRDETIWRHPWLTADGDVRDALLRLGPQIPAMLDRLDTLPQALPHGDASPQNLLVPAGAAGFVAIDLSFRTAHALGFDLGQLLIGLTHAGLRPADSLPRTAAIIVPAYLAGLAAAGVTGVDTEVRDGFATSVLLRSGFDGFRYDLLGRQDEASRHTFAERVTMTRHLLDLYRTMR